MAHVFKTLIVDTSTSSVGPPRFTEPASSHSLWVDPLPARKTDPSISGIYHCPLVHIYHAIRGYIFMVTNFLNALALLLKRPDRLTRSSERNSRCKLYHHVERSSQLCSWKAVATYLGRNMLHILDESGCDQIAVRVRHIKPARSWSQKAIIHHDPLGIAGVAPLK